ADRARSWAARFRGQQLVRPAGARRHASADRREGARRRDENLLRSGAATEADRAGFRAGHRLDAGLVQGADRARDPDVEGPGGAAEAEVRVSDLSRPHPEELAFA